MQTTNCCGLWDFLDNPDEICKVDITHFFTYDLRRKSYMSIENSGNIKVLLRFHFSPLKLIRIIKNHIIKGICYIQFEEEPAPGRYIASSNVLSTKGHSLWKRGDLVHRVKKS